MQLNRVCLIPKTLLTTYVKYFKLFRIRARGCQVTKHIQLIIPALEYKSVNISSSLFLQFLWPSGVPTCLRPFS